MTETAIKEGWGVKAPGERKYHYYRDTMSLCGKRGLYRDDLTEHKGTFTDDDCAACRRKLEREAGVEPGKPEHETKKLSKHRYIISKFTDYWCLYKEGTSYVDDHADASTLKSAKQMIDRIHDGWQK